MAKSPEQNFETPANDELAVVNAVNACYDEARNYSQEWRDKAANVWDMIHGRVDWSHKADDQAQVHLNKLGLAHDRFKGQAKQGLMNFDEWLIVEQVPNMESELLSEFEAKRMIKLLTRNCDLKTEIADNLGIGFVENLTVTKVQTALEEIQGPGGTTLKSPRTRLLALDILTYYADPEMDGLYEIHEAEVPKFHLMKLAAEAPSPAKPYKIDVVRELRGSPAPTTQEKSDNSGQENRTPRMEARKTVTVREFYGTLLSPDGEIMEWAGADGTFPLENVLVTIAEGKIIRDPVRLSNLFIDGATPFVAAQLIRSHKHLYGKSLGHPGYEMNWVLDEMTSAGIDAGLTAAYNLVGVRPDLLVDPEVASGGFKYGGVVKINARASSVREAIDTLTLGELPATFFQIYGEMQRAFAEQVRTNEPGLSGALPGKQVRATELVQAQNVVQSLDESVFMDIEDVYLEKLIIKIYRQGLQFASKFNDLDLAYIFSGDAERAGAFKAATRNKAQLFKELAYSFRFRGKGLRGIISTVRLGQAAMNLMNLAVTNPLALDTLEREGYSIPRIFEAGIKGFNIVDPEKLKDPAVARFAQERQLARETGEAIGRELGQQQGARPNLGANPRENLGAGETEPGNNQEGVF